MTQHPDAQITRMLRAASEGDRQAAAELLPLLYSELRKLAQARMAKTPPGNTLQPTALVHEAYLRLVGTDEPSWSGRAHFFGAAAQAMRDILVEQARRKSRLKHGGNRRRLDLDAAEPAVEPPAEDILALNEGLRELEQADPRRGRIVMLRYFAGLSSEETAAALGISLRTVEREWRSSKAFLRGFLSNPEG